jgi:Tol biopolymer transport system component
MLKNIVIAMFLCACLVQANRADSVVFIKDNAVYLSSTNSNAARKMPNSADAFLASLSPDGQYLVFFTGSSQKHKGFFCRVPFLTCQKLKLNSEVVYGFMWSGNGNRFFLAQQTKSVLISLPSMNMKTFKFFPRSISGDGLTLAYTTPTDIRLDVGGKQRVVFAVPKSQNALDWAFGGISLSTDGQKLYFASNAGNGINDEGTTRWRWYVVNTNGGKPKALKLPAFTGRIPDSVELSRDNQKMVFAFANQTASSLYLLNIQQNELRTMAQNPNGALNGTFSKDSKFLAIGSNDLQNGALVSEVKIVNLAGVPSQIVLGASQYAW